MMKKELGIYIHIPFCVRKCAYCDFLSAPAGEETRERYVDMLKEEMKACQELSEKYEVSTVFFGGGTPSLLSGDQILELLLELGRYFPLRRETEITVECNPGTLTEEKLSKYREAGVNRLSLGLQSSFDEELRLLGRIHTWEDFRQSFLLARRMGFSNINVDLMSALPGQTRASWEETLGRVLQLSPEHISAYSLIIEEGTPFALQYGEGRPREGELPTEDEERQMYYDTKRLLEAAGYERYEISNYARPGFSCRHNRNCWERKDYKGFGIGAASLLDNVRYKNAEALSPYLEGRFSYESVEVLSRREQQEETMFLGLRKMEGVRLTEELNRVYEKVFLDLEEKGLLERKEGRAFLTERGIDVSNYAMAEFLQEEEV